MENLNFFEHISIDYGETAIDTFYFLKLSWHETSIENFKILQVVDAKGCHLEVVGDIHECELINLRSPSSEAYQWIL
jgi:hypothetical protein